MKILLGYFKAKASKKMFPNLQLEMRAYTKLSNDNGVRVVNLAASKISQSKVQCKSTMFTHRNLPNFTWKSPEGKDTQSN
jgi:hypothetical protein